MLRLDEEDEAAADVIRDLMDPLWYRLTDEERAFLDSAGGLAGLD